MPCHYQFLLALYLDDGIIVASGAIPLFCSPTEAFVMGHHDTLVALFSVRGCPGEPQLLCL